MICVAIVAHWTQAFVRSRFIDTFCTEATEMLTFGAFIDIDARAIRLGAISLRTSAIADTTRNRYALSAWWTFAAILTSGQYAAATNKFVRRLALTFGGAALFTNHIRIAIEIRWTQAFVTSGQIFAQRIHSACGPIADHTAFVNVNAFLGGGVALEALTTNAHIFADIIVDNAIFALAAWM